MTLFKEGAKIKKVKKVKKERKESKMDIRKVNFALKSYNDFGYTAIADLSLVKDLVKEVLINKTGDEGYYNYLFDNINIKMPIIAFNIENTLKNAPQNIKDKVFRGWQTVGISDFWCEIHYWNLCLKMLRRY